MMEFKPMSYLSTNPGVWMLLFVFGLLMGLVGVCIATPGNSIIKRSLLWASTAWAIALLAICALSVLDDNHLGIPSWLEISATLLIQVMVVSFTHMMYAVAEKDRRRSFQTRACHCSSFGGIAYLF